ncbi:MAG: agmatinase [Gemmatimonadota bacterium]
MPDPPDSLRALPWELPHTFLGLDEDASRFADARAVILPVPYESTTSYGGGAKAGPRAILDASRYLELYDQELDREPWTPGIATLPPLELSRAGPEAACAELAAAYRALLEEADGKFVVALGGEHSITAEPVLAWADRLEADGRRLSVLQLDAHTDLRPAYEGTAYSHASVMHRVADRVGIVAVGVRALTSDEKRFADQRDGVRIFFADDIHADDGWVEEAVDALGPDVYITLDVDGFDPALMPSTGTPEPGGLGWYPVLELLRRVCETRRVHAADIVELAPVQGLHAPDVLAAKLLYKLIAYRLWMSSD